MLAEPVQGELGKLEKYELVNMALITVVALPVRYAKPVTRFGLLSIDAAVIKTVVGQEV